MGRPKTYFVLCFPKGIKICQDFFLTILPFSPSGTAGYLLFVSNTEKRMKGTTCSAKTKVPWESVYR